MIVKSAFKIGVAAIFGAFVVYQVKKHTKGIIDDE